MPVFAGKCSPCTGKKYSHQYHVLAETERFLWLVGDSLYPGFRSKWKLWLNIIISGVDPQAKWWALTVSVSHQTPYTSHARSKNYKTLTASIPSTPFPWMDRTQGMCADCKIPDCSISVWIKKKSISLAVRFPPVHFHSSSICISMVQGSIIVGFVLFFLPLCWPNHQYHHLLQMKKPLVQLRKLSQPPSIISIIKQQKIKQYNNACMTDFP